MPSGYRDGAGTHRCPGPACNRQVASDMLACGRHWRQVSPDTQTAVYAAWRRGAGRGTPEHTEAMDRAISEMKP
jgi:hypothetical protein